ncbi:MAG: three-Cys-motif partner protein TcmP [Microbacterium ginsengisoli]|uniref:three-Cys-motif partner protein TcmP n=1 Tax=Microbacterium TaxID=33882 RepID=UPI001ACFC995|nr:three-Cys-motif partner protein TcmP [Microbacterium sp. 71-23]MBN9198468.1 three-Cys-motif partner protein TcmP [Microbacterium ginsengisoli]
MTANEDFFQGRKPAAVLKHAVLEGYLSVFATMTGSTGSGTVWAIDAYAGPGIYAAIGDEPAAAGSPQIVCDLANRLSARVCLRGVFIERKPTYADQLRTVVGDGGEHVVFNGDAADFLPEAIRAAGSDPVLLFLDPFGVSLPRDLLIETVTGRPRGATTEVLLNFNVEAVSRIGGILMSPRTQPHDVKTLRRADEFLGGDWWRDAFIAARRSNDTASATAAAQEVSRIYQQTVFDRTGLRAVHVPIRRRTSAQPLFFLTLFTRYPKAPYIFIDVASSANQKWREFNRRLALSEDLDRYSGSLIPADMAGSWSEADHRDTEARLEEEWVREIKRNIVALLQERGSLVVATSIAEIYGSTITLAREKHLHRAWDQLSAERVVLPRVTKPKTRDQTIRPFAGPTAEASRSR